MPTVEELLAPKPKATVEDLLDQAVPVGEIRQDKGLLGRIAERAGVPTTFQGLKNLGLREAISPGGWLVRGLNLPFAALGETTATAGQAAGIERPVSRDIRPDVGDLAEWAVNLSPVLRFGRIGSAPGAVSREVVETQTARAVPTVESLLGLAKDKAAGATKVEPPSKTPFGPPGPEPAPSAPRTLPEEPPSPAPSAPSPTPPPPVLSASGRKVLEGPLAERFGIEMAKPGEAQAPPWVPPAPPKVKAKKPKPVEMPSDEPAAAPTFERTPEGMQGVIEGTPKPELKLEGQASDVMQQVRDANAARAQQSIPLSPTEKVKRQNPNAFKGAKDWSLEGAPSLADPDDVYRIVQNAGRIKMPERGGFLFGEHANLPAWAKSRQGASIDAIAEDLLDRFPHLGDRQQVAEQILDTLSRYSQLRKDKANKLRAEKVAAEAPPPPESEADKNFHDALSFFDTVRDEQGRVNLALFERRWATLQRMFPQQTATLRQALWLAVRQQANRAKED